MLHEFLSLALDGDRSPYKLANNWIPTKEKGRGGGLQNRYRRFEENKIILLPPEIEQRSTGSQTAGQSLDCLR